MRFTKMQGVGNDFVLVDEAELPLGTDLPALARQVCARHVSVGADGLLTVARGAGRAALSMRMFNPDGSEDMCGNGLRCVALWAHGASWAGADCFTVATKEGPREVKIVGLDLAQGMVRAGMGVPRFAPADIPFLGAGTEPAQGGMVLGSPLAIDGSIYSLNLANTGSTHAVIFGPAPTEDVFQRVSPQIEMQPLFPARTSVLWATRGSKGGFAVRIWERGAGETWGCGTGACAVGVLARVLELTPPGPVDVTSRGGTLQIDWPEAGAEIRMTGPAQSVFEGELEYREGD